MIGEGTQSKSERGKKHVGVPKDPGNTDHMDERGNWEENVHLWKSGVCMYGLIGVHRHGEPRSVSRSPTARAEGTR